MKKTMCSLMVTVLVTPNTFQHALFHSFHPNSTRKDTHGQHMECKKPMVRGQHVDDAVQAARQLDAVWRTSKNSAKNTAGFVHSSPERLFYPKLFLLYCLGSQALKGTALGDAWNG